MVALDRMPALSYVVSFGNTFSSGSTDRLLSFYHLSSKTFTVEYDTRQSK